MNNLITKRFPAIYEKPPGVDIAPPVGVRVNLHPNGGYWEPLLFFSSDCQKTAARSAAIFGTPIHACLPHMLWETSDPDLSRSDHQVTSCDLTSQNVWMLVIATPTEWLPWNFQRLIQVTVSIKSWTQNLDIGDLRSGTYGYLSILTL